MTQEEKEQIMRRALVQWEEYQGKAGTSGYDRNLSPQYIDQLISDLKTSGNFEKAFKSLTDNDWVSPSESQFNTGRSRDEFELLARPAVEARKYQSLKQNGPRSIEDIRYMANYSEPEQMMSKDVEPTVRELEKRYYK